MRRRPITAGTNVWANTAANFDPTHPTSKIHFSNGYANSAQGCMNVDPQFVAGPAGDLRLLPTSPCIAAADLAASYAAASDHVEGSYFLDGAQTGNFGSDMGAFELGVYSLVVTGRLRTNDALSFDCAGPAGFAVYAVGVVSGAQPWPGFGFFFLGDANAPLLLGASTIGSPLVLTMPDLAPILGLELAVQAFAITNADPTKGNFTNLWRAVVEY